LLVGLGLETLINTWAKTGSARPRLTGTSLHPPINERLKAEMDHQGNG